MDPSEKISLKKVQEAIHALVEFVEKKNAAEQRLFDQNSETVQLSFTLRDIPVKAKHKPTLIHLPTPLYEGRSVCIVVKDPQRTYKDLFAEHPPHEKYRVVGVSKLKTKFRRFEDRRELCDAHDLFLCDTKVMDMMPQVLGKYFFTTKKKLPIPVKIAPKDDAPAKPLLEAIHSTVLRTPSGPSCGVKIGRCDMAPDDLYANAKKVLAVVFKYFAAEGNAVTAVQLQATDAPALPVWRAALADVTAKASPKKRPASAVEESPKRKASAPSVAELSKENKRRKTTKK